MNPPRLEGMILYKKPLPRNQSLYGILSSQGGIYTAIGSIHSYGLSKSKQSGNIQPFSVIEFQLWENKNASFHPVLQIHKIQSEAWRQIRVHCLWLWILFLQMPFLSESLDTQSGIKAYEMLLAIAPFLSHMQTQEHTLVVIHMLLWKWIFLTKNFSMHCVSCEKSIQQEKSLLFLSSDKEGFLCASCAQSHPQPYPYLISEELGYCLKNFLFSSFSSIFMELSQWSPALLPSLEQFFIFFSNQYLPQLYWGDMLKKFKKNPYEAL